MPGNANYSETDTNNTSPLSNQKWTLWRSLIAYWILGLCNNYGYVVMLSAAHDILKDIEHLNANDDDNESVTTPVPAGVRDCNKLSTGAILLADIVPALIIKFTAPFLPFFIHIRVALCVLLAAAGYLLVAYATSEGLAIAGVIATSLASGLGEVSYLQYSSFFSKNVVSTWSSGTGGAGILGSLSYAWLATFGLRKALLIMLFVPTLMTITFWIILPTPDRTNSQIELQITETVANQNNISESLKKKLKILPELVKFMIPLALVYLFEYFINQGMFELIQFDDIFLTNSGQYHWLQVDYQLGVFISRSSVNILHIRKIWILSLLQLINVVLFTFEAIYYYIPSIWIVFALTLWEGLLGGAAYVNTFYRISKEVEVEKKQFSLSATSISDTIGITLAGIMALPAHNAICDLPKPIRRTF